MPTSSNNQWNPEQAFLEVIEANPGDDAPKLIYADWLDENGGEKLAEFLRIWVLLYRKTINNDHVTGLVRLSMELSDMYVRYSIGNKLDSILTECLNNEVTALNLRLPVTPYFH